MISPLDLKFFPVLRIVLHLYTTFFENMLTIEKVQHRRRLQKDAAFGSFL